VVEKLMQVKIIIVGDVKVITINIITKTMQATLYWSDGN
jgi:hypothetical protein